jgi:eukaryotic-like serine/threonine-protein kinase
MPADNWQHFKEIFQAALDLPPNERPAYLKSVCTEPRMRVELESLLFCYQGGTGPSVISLAEELTATPKTGGAQPDPLIESFLDRYQIIAAIERKESEIAYRALRLHAPNSKHVTIRMGVASCSPAEFLRWFNGVRTRLSSLQHPNIAVLEDGGVTKEGCPYLVVEDVQGIQIDEYCDNHRLSTCQRIDLFLKVCHGLQYAHEHLVGHGCLDPQSILVTREGIPKVLDLGTADAFERELPLSDASGKTMAMLEYASPDQIRGLPAAAGDDVFALGVLLYRLLSGHSPYRLNDEGKDEMLPAIFEAVKPSQALLHNTEEITADGTRIKINLGAIEAHRKEATKAVRRLLAGDLDSIVLKAIQKDSWKRYSSVEQLSGDIQRYLEGQPVSSRTSTFSYRSGKLLRRHKTAVIVVSSLLLLFIVVFTLLLETVLRH